MGVEGSLPLHVSFSIIECKTFMKILKHFTVFNFKLLSDLLFSYSALDVSPLTASREKK